MDPMNHGDGVEAWVVHTDNCCMGQCCNTYLAGSAFPYCHESSEVASFDHAKPQGQMWLAEDLRHWVVGHFLRVYVLVAAHASGLMLVGRRLQFLVAQLIFPIASWLCLL